MLQIKVVKGLKNGPNYKIQLTPYVIDCSHYSISINGYLLRRSKKNHHLFILESMIKQDPSTIRFELSDYTSLKDQALIARSNRSFTKYILDMRQP